ncbi:mandelate racemase/muconate lactonizing enzyme family protein [Psychromicrobium lacuslunae]|uniref:mandelate racemase/muconate lactonizing enzyme family protein n=1 Tax=Psychromicrobium lacuslunae TaxID=1618207 RepID=UPI000698CBC4|nr:enolase C-terminal domain-like protein [Psychromicrobium lacuslunae]
MIAAELTPFELPLHTPFRNSQGVTHSVHQPLLALSEHEVSGYGSVRGADLAELEAITEWLKPRSATESELIRWELNAAGYSAAVRATVDIALLDLRGRQQGLSVRTMLGLDGGQPPPSAISLPVAEPAETAAAARLLSKAPVLKLKVTPETAIGAIRAVRSEYAGPIRIDGNGSFSVAQALHVIEQAADELELFEQPTPAADLAALAELHAASAVPIAADESVTGIAAISELAGKVSCVNLKMIRIGGLGEMLTALGLARTLGLRVMLGSKLESSLGLTAVAQLAGLADYLDLDGASLLADDFASGLTLSDGVLKLPTGPGLGCTMKREVRNKP